MSRDLGEKPPAFKEDQQVAASPDQAVHPPSTIGRMEDLIAGLPRSDHARKSRSDIGEVLIIGRSREEALGEQGLGTLVREP